MNLDLSMTSKITILISTVCERSSTFQTVFQGLVNQADRICVSLNGYTEVPIFVRNESRVSYKINEVDLRRANHVWDWMSDVEGTVFIADDDILYPDDYVQRMVDFLASHRNKIVASVHGKWFDSQGKIGLTHFKFELPAGIQLDVAGVGTCSFHTDLLRPSLNDFPQVYFRDLQFSLLCRKNSIPIYAIPREVGWLKPLKTIGSTLCDTTRQDRILHAHEVQLLKEIRCWSKR